MAQRQPIHHSRTGPVTGQTPEALPAFWPTAELFDTLQSLLKQFNSWIDFDAYAVIVVHQAQPRIVASAGLQALERAELMAAVFQKGRALRRWLRSGQPAGWQELLTLEPALASVSALRERFPEMLAVPLHWQREPRGSLLLFTTRPAAYAEARLPTILILANQIALALEHARLAGETRRQALQLEATRLISRQVSSISEMDELLAEVAALIEREFNCASAHLYLFEGSTEQLRWHSPRPWAGMKPADFGERALGAWPPWLINGEGGGSPSPAWGLSAATPTELVLPLRVGEAVIGVLDLQPKPEGAFAPEAVAAIQTLADHIAVAIENAQLFRRLRHHYDVMRVLHDISLEITSQLESRTVLQVILRQAARLLNAQGSTLGLYDPAADVIRKEAVFNVPPEVQGVALRPNEGAAGKVMTTGEPLIVNNYYAWAGRSPQFQPGLLSAVLCVPLRWHGQVIGVLDVIDQGAHRQFVEDDARTLSGFADLATIAIKNAELYAQVKQTGEQLEQKIEQRTRELAEAREALARNADQLQRLLAQTLHIQEQERTRIARDLHDGSNQLITGTLYLLQAAQESLRQQRVAVATEKLEVSKELLRELEAENRRIIAGLRPAILDAQGLVPTLEWYARDFQTRHACPCSVQVFGPLSRLAPEVETMVFRIVQESLTNVAAHASAQAVQIHVDFRPKLLRVWIQDDGVGFDTAAWRAQDLHGMGLIGIRERAQSIAAQVEIQSQPGRGTQITLLVPLEAG